MKEQTMNIKPSGQQVEKWIAEASSEGGKILDPNKLAELAAKWGASQAQQTTADAGRVLEWMRTPNRKPANLAFTDGPERQAAYWIEIAQQRVAQQTTEPELPEPEAIRHSFDGYGWMYIDNGHGSGWRSGIDKADAEFMYTAAQMHDHYAAGVRSGMGQSQWQPIETAPKDGRSFDVWVKSTKNPDYGVRMTGVYYVQGVLCGSRFPNSSWCEYASHWMPLPEPPAMQGDNHE